MIKRIIALIVLIIMIQLALTACKKEEVIEIGFIGTLSGSGSDLTVSGRRGAELAVEIINESGGAKGKKLVLVMEDDKNDPLTALKGIETLRKSDVKLVVGPFTSHIALSLVEYVNQHEMLLLGPTISADVLTKKEDNFISFIASTKEQASILGTIALEKNHDTISIVYDKNNAGFAEALVENYINIIETSNSAQIYKYEYDPLKAGERERVVNDISNNIPEGLFIVASAEECAIVAKEVMQLSSSIQLYGPLWANTSELIKKGGHYVEKMILVGALDLDSSNGAVSDFVDLFFDRYGEMPTFSSIYTYDVVMTLAEAIENSDKVIASEIKQVILEKGYIESLEGQIEMNAYGDCSRLYKLFQVQNGKMMRLND